MRAQQVAHSSKLALEREFGVAMSCTKPSTHRKTTRDHHRLTYTATRARVPDGKV
jgi:hypothetical protein